MFALCIKLQKEREREEKKKKNYPCYHARKKYERKEV